MASDTITVKLDASQVREVINTILREIGLTFVCQECLHVIHFDKVEPIVCEHCGQKWSLRVVGEKIE